MSPVPESDAMPLAGPAPRVRVTIEIPRGSFLKRGSDGSLDFVSPLPCPFNYGSIPGFLGLDGDLLDAVVLGPRLATGTRVTLPVRGAVGLLDRDIYDDKLVCSARPLGTAERRAIVAFFAFYGQCKRLFNLGRRRPGRTRCTGWQEATAALLRARPRPPDWRAPSVPF